MQWHGQVSYIDAVLAARPGLLCIATSKHGERLPGEITKKLLLQTVKVFLSIEILMLVGDSDVQAVLRLEEVSVFMLW